MRLAFSSIALAWICEALPPSSPAGSPRCLLHVGKSRASFLPSSFCGYACVCVWESVSPVCASVCVCLSAFMCLGICVCVRISWQTHPSYPSPVPVIMSAICVGVCVCVCVRMYVCMCCVCVCVKQLNAFISLLAVPLPHLFLPPFPPRRLLHLFHKLCRPSPAVAAAVAAAAASPATTPTAAAAATCLTA